MIHQDFRRFKSYLQNLDCTILRITICHKRVESLWIDDSIGIFFTLPSDISITALVIPNLIIAFDKVKNKGGYLKSLTLSSSIFKISDFYKLTKLSPTIRYVLDRSDKIDAHTLLAVIVRCYEFWTEYRNCYHLFQWASLNFVCLVDYEVFSVLKSYDNINLAVNLKEMGKKINIFMKIKVTSILLSATNTNLWILNYHTVVLSIQSMICTFKQIITRIVQRENYPSYYISLLVKIKIYIDCTNNTKIIHASTSNALINAKSPHFS
ncbi:hypothetical protein AGLY_010953 [Aphis glycines]|uniref:Uncharacterized protein n=1 Tax=Aphis glycines TaxID=307491 RepID=A0A6G0TE77_APHGL|nr:hypothetical protein AGLY_010953 [Aphis glycines]